MAAVYPELRRTVDRILAELRPVIEAGVKEAYRQQFRGRYAYIVGEWRGKRRAKSSVTGAFVRPEEVIAYLRGR